MANRKYWFPFSFARAGSLRSGSRRDAFLHGIEVNRAQKGLPFTRGDLEKCIFTLLQDEETRKFTQSKIATLVGCSQGYVSFTAKKYADAIVRPDKIIDRNGVIRSKGAYDEHAATPSRRALALKLYLKGVPKIQIAREIGVARSATQRYIRDAIEEAELVTCPHCQGSGMIKRQIHQEA